MCRSKISWLVCVGLFSLFGAASVSAWVSTIEFQPAMPMANTPFQVVISGQLPSTCWDADVAWSSISRDGNVLTMAVIANERPEIVCGDALVFYRVEQSAPALPPGKYVLIVMEYHHSDRFPEPTMFAATVEVVPGGGSVVHVPADAATIQAGLDAVANGGTVLVASGTYTGQGNHDLDFHGKSVLLKSVDGAEATIIDCQKGARGFYFHTNEDTTAVVSGFTITNGLTMTNGTGGGVWCDKASPRIEECIFSHNEAAYFGGAIYLSPQSAPQIVNCTFADNMATSWASYAGAIGGYTCSPRIEECLFQRDSTPGYGGAIFFTHGGNPQIKDCRFEHNGAIHGGALGYYAVSGTIEGCTFDRNFASQLGGAIFLQDQCSPAFSHCTFYGNSGQFSGTIFVQERTSNPDLCAPSFANVLIAYSNSSAAFSISNARPVFSCTDIYGNAANWDGGLAEFLGQNGNISEDPLFCDAPAGNLGISDGSPCAAANNSCNALIGSMDVDCDGDMPMSTDDPGGQPRTFAVQQNYPNPFNPSTVIAFSLPATQQVTVAVYNMLGQQVKVLVDSYLNAGDHKIVWDGTDNAGNTVATGIYFYHVNAGQYNQTRKMAFVK